MTISDAPLVASLLIAVVGGLLSFLSPCVLPLVPGYLGYLTGSMVQGEQAPPRRELLAHSLAFVLGFAVIFTVAGLALGLLVLQLQQGLDILRWFGGLAVIVLGLHTLGLFRISLLDRQARIGMDGSLRRGRLVTSFLIGIFFAAGWTPCVGVILSAIFAMAVVDGGRAGALFFAYAVGLGIPFVLTALLIGRATPLLRRINRRAGIVNAVSGMFLIIIGILLLTDSFTRLAIWAPVWEPGFLS
jgi:cytochrome c-type biogenesis protein